MSVLDAQKAIIRAVNPGMRLDGKNATYIKAAFDLAKDTMNTRKDTNFQRNQMVNGGGARRADGATVPNAKKARENMIARSRMEVTSNERSDFLYPGNPPWRGWRPL